MDMAKNSQHSDHLEEVTLQAPVLLFSIDFLGAGSLFFSGRKLRDLRDLEVRHPEKPRSLGALRESENPPVVEFGLCGVPGFVLGAGCRF